ncbi:MAG: hypothetical protein ABSC10_12650 [Candidatus Acidiferrales bacterium]|jgi:hypothetical protein
MKRAPVVFLAALGLATFGLSAATPQQPSTVHVWRESQKPDDSSISRFTLVGKFLKSPQTDVPNRPALVLDCVPATTSHKSEGKFVAGNLLVGIPLKIDYIEPEEIHGTSYYPKVVVHYRINDTKEEEDKWTPGTDKLSSSISKESLKRMLRARTVEISTHDDRGKDIAMQFDMPDSTAVEAACNVDEHK